MSRNSTPLPNSARAWLRSVDVRAGWHDAMRGAPADYDARPRTLEATRYEMGRQLALWARQRGLCSARPTPPTVRMLKWFAADTGLPRSVGVNA